jgi:hypothetical protein
MTVKANAKAPISRHPLFAAVVALWFAALLGLGSLAISNSVIENAVLAAHIDSLVPAAAPPLGFTARLLLAGALALAGAIVGFVLARMVAGSGRGEARAEAPRRPAKAARAAEAEVAMPAAEDDNDDLARLDAARQRSAPRRRALSLESEAPAVLRIDDLADIDELDPAPANLRDAPAEQTESVPAEGAAPEVATAEEASPRPAPATPVSTTPMAVAPAVEPEQEPAPVEVEAESPAAPRAPVTAPVVAAEPVQRDSLAVFAGRIPADAAALLRAAALDELGVPQLVERLALALSARRSAAPAPATTAATAPTVAPAPEPVIAPVIVPAPEAVVAPVLPVAPPAALLEQAPPFAPPATPEVLSAAASAPEAEGTTRPFDMPPSMREPGLGNIDWFDDFEDEDPLESLLPPKRPTGRDPFAAPIASEAGADESPADILAEARRWALPEAEEPVDEDDLPEEADDGPYSSLLNITPSFVRIEEEADDGDVAEPVVIFPGQAAAPQPIPARLPGAPFGANPAQTEDALREALAALQKMSGAA